MIGSYVVFFLLGVAVIIMVQILVEDCKPKTKPIWSSKSAHQIRVEEMISLIPQELPDVPTITDVKTRLLRLRLQTEECFIEAAEALGFMILVNDKEVKTIEDIKFIPIKTESDLSIELIADMCADSSVVVTGTMSACGIHDVELLKEVDKNNLAKFGPGGYRDEYGKWIKPRDHKPPDIKRVLEEQIKRSRRR